MDEVRIVRHRTHIWPVIIAVIVLALVIAYVFFASNGPANQVGQYGPSALFALDIPIGNAGR